MSTFAGGVCGGVGGGVWGVRETTAIEPWGPTLLKVAVAGTRPPLPSHGSASTHFSPGSCVHTTIYSRTVGYSTSVGIVVGTKRLAAKIPAYSEDCVRLGTFTVY